MTKDEALKLALEALSPDPYRSEWAVALDMDNAITAIKEALAEQDSKDKEQAKTDSFVRQLDEALAQQALDRKAENARELGLDYEPEKTVCPFCTSEWVTAEQHDRNVDRVEQEPCCYGGIAHDCHAGKGCRIVERMKAATPPQRTWVGLTDEEIDKAWRSCDYTVPWEQHRIDIARAIEAKLKEKNNA